jgi:hypothetical protein
MKPLSNDINKWSDEDWSDLAKTDSTWHKLANIKPFSGGFVGISELLRTILFLMPAKKGFKLYYLADGKLNGSGKTVFLDNPDL